MTTENNDNPRKDERRKEKNDKIWKRKNLEARWRRISLRKGVSFVKEETGP
jgi:hypothetical protein